MPLFVPERHPSNKGQFNFREAVNLENKSVPFSAHSDFAIQTDNEALKYKTSPIRSKTDVYTIYAYGRDRPKAAGRQDNA